MIDGTDGFHFIGLTTCDKGAMLIFQEGMLMLDQHLPGWGVMPQATLAHLFPELRPGAASPGRRPGSSSDEEGGWPSVDELLYFHDLSASASTEGSSGSGASNSGSRSPSPTPPASASASPSSDDEALPDWAPPANWLGWWPTEALAHVGRVNRTALTRYRAIGNDPRALKDLSDDFHAGHLAPTGANDAGTGVMLELRLFGLPRLLAWAGPWMLAGHPALAKAGLTPQRMAALVAHAMLAPCCNLAEVPELDNSTCLGHVEDAQARVLVFDNGLLVQRHPQGRLEGWHPMGTNGHWDLVAPDIGDVLDDLCETQADVREQALVQHFFGGGCHEPAGQRFAALTLSQTRHRWTSLQLDAPHGLVAPDGAGAPGAADLLQARRNARRAAIHNWQLVHDAYSLGCGAWQVPLLLGAVRCLLGVHPVPGLLATTWHDTLAPLIERQLLAHRADEQKWLADGVIRQPIDALIDLMRRDKRLSRPEVAVMWPVTLMGELFKSLAPQVAVRCTPLPRLEDVEAALTHKAGRLLVFKPIARPVQSVVVAVFQQCWADEDAMDVEQLRARVRRACGPGAIERVVGLATID